MQHGMSLIGLLVKGIVIYPLGWLTILLAHGDMQFASDIDFLMADRPG